MKKLLILIPIACLLGCASFSTNTLRTEKAATDMAYTAVTTWKAYYHPATNECAYKKDTAKWAKLDDADKKINEACRQFAASVRVVDALRMTYETNSTVQGQIPPALMALSQQSSNIIWLITYLKGL